MPVPFTVMDGMTVVPPFEIRCDYSCLTLLVLLLIIGWYASSAKSHPNLSSFFGWIYCRSQDGVKRDDDNNNDNNNDNPNNTNEDGFTILKETVMYNGWKTIVNRQIRMRNGKVGDFDLVGLKTGKGGVLVFIWDTQTKTAIMLREYMPASHKMLYGQVGGLVEDKHGSDISTAARYELEEEAHLTGGTWISLSKRSSFLEKYAFTLVDAFLVLDPIKSENPRPKDNDEDIEIIDGVTIPQIMEWIANGEMNLVSGWGCMFAIEKLRELGEYP